MAALPLGITSIEDARQLSEVVEQIQRNLRLIKRDLLDMDDLNGLRHTTGIIAQNLGKIADNEMNLDALEEQTSKIVGYLEIIDDDENDLNALLAATSTIVARLNNT